MGTHSAILRSLLTGCIILTALGAALAQRDTIRTRVDLVVVPVSVKDTDGKFVYDLKKEDFSIFEDGRPQAIRELSNDATPLSVAVLIDTGLGASALGRFANSIVSLSSALVEGDEAEVYRFDHIISQLSGFTSNPEEIEKSLGVVQRMSDKKTTQGDGPPIILPGRGPRWLRWLLDSGAPDRLLNDAMFAAATDLEQRAPDRRKVIMVISDGQAVGKPVHSLDETKNRLVQSQIETYGISVGLGILGGATSMLNTYADATGGDVYSARDQKGMENAFSRITEQARFQYVLSYVSDNEIARGQPAVLRKIEVRTARPGLKLNHRQSYLQYPLP